MKSVPAIVALTAILFALPAQAQRGVSLQARTAGELADLCGTNPKDPLGDARINFCHGFAQGAITVELRHTEGKKPFCFPSPAPSRSATMGEFVSWVRSMPDRKSQNAVDGFFQFLGERYPCK
ncbi:MAG TPA: Rap1a/Tai family immunity protein [Acetobacteraceae bacterium]|nr:Rap1a/Tai family immunity protein [Acetobacteraceae bacterium]